MMNVSTPENETPNAPVRRRRGFATMSPEKQREIASKGGRAAHEQGTAHEWTAEEARSASQRSPHVRRHREREWADTPNSTAGTGAE